MDNTFLLLALIVLLSYTTHALSGFGSMIIAITLGVRRNRARHCCRYSYRWTC